MTNSKSTKKALFSSAVALFLCFSMLLGTTYAWFTDSVSAGLNKIQSGNLDIALYHIDYTSGDYSDPNAFEPVGENTPLFLNVDGKPILWEPGAGAEEDFRIVNEGSLALKYRFMVTYANATETPDGKTLADILDVTMYQIGGTFTDEQFKNPVDGTVISPENNGLDDGVVVEGYLLPGEDIRFLTTINWYPSDNDNDFNVPGGLSLDLGITLLATQYTYEKDDIDDQYDKDATYPELNTADVWDGTADTSWYNDNDTEFIITTAEQLAGLADLVDDGNTFEGKTIKLANDLDLKALDSNGDPISFDPIGYGYNTVFKGTFDGQGNTISNLYQNGWALGLSYGTQGGGLFASVVDATFKDLSIDNAEVVMECVDMGVLVGYSYGNCTYENISVSNSLIANYQRYTGGVVGEVNGTQTFKNVDVDENTVISSLWGDFDCSLGGIVGGKYGEATLTFEDCDVACELNAYNDVTSSYRWYAYRRAGMLIGNSEETVTAGGRTSATASYLTAKNCTVTYGDWVNYTYCEFAGTSWPYVRVQAGYSCDAYSNPRYGVATDANGNKAVDDSHVHNEGEDHNMLCVFDQLFGGGQGVYGTNSHEGVTVNYNN